LLLIAIILSKIAIMTFFCGKYLYLNVTNARFCCVFKIMLNFEQKSIRYYSWQQHSSDVII